MTEPMKPSQRLEYQASIDRPRLELPDGKRVAVFIVVNVENWEIERAMPRQVLTAPQGASAIFEELVAACAVEDALVEELRRDEEGLVRVKGQNPLVDVKPEHRVDRIAQPPPAVVGVEGAG